MITTKQGMYMHFKNTSKVSRKLILNYDNYKKICYDSNSYRGITRLEVNMMDDKNETELGRMIYEITNCSKFDNINRLHLNAPHIPLDGSILDTISRKKSYVRSLLLNVFTIYNPPKDMWNNLNGLEDLCINISDGFMVPDAVSKVIEKSKVNETISIVNESPFYPSFDIDIIDNLIYMPKNIYISGYYINGDNIRGNVHLSKCKYKN